MTQEHVDDPMSNLVSRAWHDSAFHSKLAAQPISVLREYGIDVPAGVAVEVVQNSGSKVYLVLPAAPTVPTADDAECESSAASAYRSVCSKSDSCCCLHGSIVADLPKEVAFA